jgi:hypothetical protein
LLLAVWTGHLLPVVVGTVEVPFPLAHSGANPATR